MSHTFADRLDLLVGQGAQVPAGEWCPQRNTGGIERSIEPEDAWSPGASRSRTPGLAGRRRDVFEPSEDWTIGADPENGKYYPGK